MPPSRPTAPPATPGRAVSAGGSGGCLVIAGTYSAAAGSRTGPGSGTSTPTARTQGTTAPGPHLLAVLAVVLGVFGMVAGQADDSPGLQGLGLLLIFCAVVVCVRTARRRSSQPRTDG